MPADGEQPGAGGTVDAGAGPGSAAEIIATKPWFGELPETNDDEKAFKGWVDKKDFKDPMSALKGYRELEKHVGANRVVMPGEKDDITQWEGWDKLGVPKEAKEYEGKIKRPDMPEGLTYDETLEKQYLEHAAKVRTPAHIVQQNIDFIAQQRIAEHNALKEHQGKETADLQALMKEWGSDKDVNVELAKRGAKFLGIPQDEIDAIESGLLGGRKVMQALLKFGKHAKEGASVDGDASPIIGIEAAKAELARFNERIGKGEKLSDEDMKTRSKLYKQIHG